MKKQQYQEKMAIYLLMASCLTFLASNSFAKTEPPKTHPATTIDRVAVAIKHKVLTEKTKSIGAEAAEIEAETHKAIVALGNKDTKGATAILQVVSTKLDNLIAKNPGLELVPTMVETDVSDFEGTNNDVAKSIKETEDLLKQGRLQTARRVFWALASEIRITTTSIPLGTYPAAIKQIIPLIDSGKIDQAAVDLSSVLDTLVIATDVMPLPVFRAEELLTIAADLEHRDDLTQEKNREEIRKFTDAAKGQLERAQLLGYGENDNYKILYQEIDAIQKTLFSEKSAAAWQKVKNELAEFKNELKDLAKTEQKFRHSAN